MEYRLNHSGQKGLTLLEILLLLLFLGGVFAWLYPVVESRLDGFRASTAQRHIDEIAAALNRYKLDNHFYPTTEQGLDALVNKPVSNPVPKNWNTKGYLDYQQVPLDPWGQAYRYTSLEDGRYFELKSLGADQAPGGEGIAADIIVSF